MHVFGITGGERSQKLLWMRVPGHTRCLEEIPVLRRRIAEGHDAAKSRSCALETCSKVEKMMRMLNGENLALHGESITEKTARARASMDYARLQLY